MANIRQLNLGIRHSLSRQLLIGFGASLLTVGLATLGINYQLVKADLESQVEDRAKSLAQTLEFSTEGLLENQSVPILQRVVQNYATLPAIVEVSIIDPSGRIRAQAPNLASLNAPYHSKHPDLASDLDKASHTGVGTFIKNTHEGKAVLTYILPFSSPLFNVTGRRGAVTITVDLQQMQKDTWQIFLTSTTTMTVGVFFILIVMGLLLKRLLLNPLSDLNAAILSRRENERFILPDHLPKNEVSFLGITFQQVFEERRQAEIGLRESEAKERKNAQELVKLLEELRETQSQLIQSAKMASLGQMVAGIAHEINNPINFIHANLSYVNSYANDLIETINFYQSCISDPPPELAKFIKEVELDFLKEDLKKVIQSMNIGTDRIRTIVLSLRSFSRLDESDFKAVDLHEGLESTLTILQNRLKAQSGQADINLIRDYEELPLVECHVSQINQVFMNILSNAIDAFNRLAHPAPQIKVKTERQGDACIIWISDNGIGIPDEHLSKIFDPFFTTKPVGEGTGLGLSVSYQIIERHKGVMKCSSQLGQGTEFYIKIPIAQTTHHINIPATAASSAA